MKDDVAQTLLAGWLSGAAAGIAITGLVLVAAARRPGLARRLPWQSRLGVLGMIVSNAVLFSLTLVGLVLGAFYHRVREDEGRFPLYVLAGAVVVGALYVFIRGRVRTAEAPVVLVSLAIAAFAFAVMLPGLASS